MKKSIALFLVVSLFMFKSNAQNDSTVKQKSTTVVKPKAAKSVKKASTPKNTGAVIVKKEEPNQMQHKADKMEKPKKESSK